MLVNLSLLVIKNFNPSSPIIGRLNNVGIFVWCGSKNKSNQSININSKPCGKCKFALKPISPLIMSNLFTLEVHVIFTLT